MTASSCKFSSQDMTEVRLNDGQTLQLRMVTSGFFPDKIKEPIEDIINEAMQTFLRESHWRWEEMRTKRSTLGEILEMEFDSLSAEFPEDIRYTHVAETAHSQAGMNWRLEVFFEQAIAACVILVDMKPKTNDQAN